MTAHSAALTLHSERIGPSRDLLVVPTDRSVRDRLADFPPIFMAVPSVPWTWTDAAVAIAAVGNYLPPKSFLCQSPNYASSITAARNHLAEHFLALATARGLEYCLWIDSDMVPTPDTAHRLLVAARESGADIISATCYGRRAPYLPTIVRLDRARGTTPSGVEEVELVGFGCVLIRREVFERIRRPWFESTNDRFEGEDYQFCRTARAAGFRVFADFSLECGHLSVIPVGGELSRAWRDTAPGRHMHRIHAEQYGRVIAPGGAAFEG